MKVWRQLLDARSFLAQSDQPGYRWGKNPADHLTNKDADVGNHAFHVKQRNAMLSQVGGYDRPQTISSTGDATAAGVHLLNNPVAGKDLFQPAEILSSFNGILSTIAEAPAEETSELLMSAGLALYHMNPSVQQQAFAGLIAVCNKLDNTIRLLWLTDAISNIVILNDCNQVAAVDTVLQLLPRLHADDIAPVMKALLKPLTGLSHQEKARALDAGILRIAHLADTPKRAVLKVLAECARRLPPALNERYYPTLLACHRSLSA